MIERIAIGTVQFGLNYGISNAGGKTSQSECSAILATAKQHGIRMLDTAIAYGDSETTLGKIGVADWQVVSKLPPIPDNTVDISRWVNIQVNESLHRLRTKELDGLLLHRPDQLLSRNGLLVYKSMLALRDRGIVKKIGISIYSPDELAALPEQMSFDIVQAPFNVLDQRMVTSGWAARLVAAGTELHARSIFLQGLLLMPKNSRPRYFHRWANLWDIWDVWLGESGLTALEACLSFALNTPHIRKLIIGVNTLSQLLEILHAAPARVPELPAELTTEEVSLLNPALWPQT